LGYHIHTVSALEYLNFRVFGAFGCADFLISEAVVVVSFGSMGSLVADAASAFSFDAVAFLVVEAVLAVSFGSAAFLVLEPGLAVSLGSTDFFAEAALEVFFAGGGLASLLASTSAKAFLFGGMASRSFLSAKMIVSVESDEQHN
jgi:hypothetical protein